MKPPTNMDEFHLRSESNNALTGRGYETTRHVPCPFCAAPDWMVFKVLETQESIVKGATCLECGRTARASLRRYEGGFELELVQTGGDDQPEWLEPKMRRVEP
jgi:hypothetical protein